MHVILVPLAGNDNDGAALTAAYAIAGRFRAHVEALFVRPDVIDAIADLEGGSPEMIGHVKRAADTVWGERAERARAALEAARAAAGAVLSERPGDGTSTTTQWTAITGRVQAIVAERGRLADLLVFAALRSTRERDWGEMFSQALVGSARPILLVPGPGIERIGQTVAIAWNGSAESTRALAGAMPLIEQAERVHILTASSPRTEVARGEALAAYLAWRGRSTELHALFPETGTGGALLDQAKKLGADLMVMGGYGRSRLSELIFGGVTRHVLAHYDLPILIAH